MKASRTSDRRRGTVLIIVLWITFGLVVLAIYFANSMSLELKASANRTADLQAEHATVAAANYVAYILATYGTNGIMPNLSQDIPEFRTAAVPVGESTFWLIGRGDQQRQQSQPTRVYFGLIDESSKLNLNTATLGQIQNLPNLTQDAGQNFAAAIIDWRDSDNNPTVNGAEDDTYAGLNPPRHVKNAPFETVEELRLVYGSTVDLLYGEDANLNGALDPNENDGTSSPPSDNSDGQLNSGLFEYFTVYSQLPTIRADGSQRVNISTAQGRQNLRQILTTDFSQDRADQIMSALGPRTFNSVLEFYAASQMTSAEFATIHTDVSATNTVQVGLVNVNTASEAVLDCIPGIGTDYAPSLVAFRISNPTRLDSMAWVTEVLPPESITQCGRYLTDQTYQLTADVAAVGPNGRGYRRTRFVFDTSTGTPRIVHRLDLTNLGWALGNDVRQQIQLAKNTLQ